VEFLLPGCGGGGGERGHRNGDLHRRGGEVGVREDSWGKFIFL